ncbi:MAG: pilin [Candidatus Campbellbacteria bacterium]|nr:pilin [Candidatus Campbellbacteria bacterium]
MKKVLQGLAIASAFTPLFAFAQLGGVSNILTAIGRLIDTATPIVIGLALLVFFWGLIKFIMNSDDDEARKKGKGLMIGGIIALFVMVAIVGIINFIAAQVGVTTGGNLPVPGVQ